MVGVLPWVRHADDSQAVCASASLWQPLEGLEAEECRLRQILAPDEDAALPRQLDQIPRVDQPHGALAELLVHVEL
jgi:hypothetical protein